MTTACSASSDRAALPSAAGPPSAAAPSSTATGPSAASPPSRAVWSGLLRHSLVTIPIKAYPATVSTPELQRHQLHAGCGQRIHYEKHCPIHGKLEPGAIITGYEHAPDRYVVLDETDLERLRPVKDRALSLERFLDPDEVDPVPLLRSDPLLGSRRIGCPAWVRSIESGPPGAPQVGP
jgi:hypothetical protein